MTATIEDLVGLPGWPAMLSAEQAAKYCGMSVDSFLALVEKGYLPKAIQLPMRRRLWHRRAIDEALSRKGASSAEARQREWQRRHKESPQKTR